MMRKRLISFILITTMFVGMLPADALAAEDTYTMTAQEVRRIENLSGYDTSTYHDGMSFSASMTAWQMYCWLDEFHSGKLSRLVSQAQTLINEIGDDAKMQNAFGKVYELKHSADEMNRDFNHYLFELDELVLEISSAANVVKNSDMPAGEKTKAYRRLQKAEKKLGQIMAEVASKANIYVQNYDAMSADLTKMHEEHGKQEMPSARSAARLLAQATPFSNLRAAGFYIDVLSANEAGFFVCDEAGKGIKGAAIYMEGNGKTLAGKTDSDGIFKYDVGLFGTDSTNKFSIYLRIEADGMRTWESCDKDQMPGSSTRVQLEKDDGTPYIQRVDFQRMDVMHEQDIIYITEMNDGIQPLDIYINQRAGDESDVIVRYVDKNGNDAEKTAHLSAKADGVTKVDMKGLWCRDVLPDTAVEIVLVNAAGEEKTIGSNQIVTEKALVSAPVTDLKPHNLIPGMNFNFSIPIKQPGLQSVDVSFNVPVALFDAIPVNVVVDLNGNIMLGVAVTGMKKYAADAGEPTRWRYTNAKEQRDKINKALEPLSVLASKDSSKAARSDAKKELLQMGSLKAVTYYWGVMGLAQIKIDQNKETKKWSGMLQGYIEVSGDVTVSGSCNGGWPAFIGIDVRFGVSTGVMLRGKFNISEKANPGRFEYLNCKYWEDWRFAGDEAEIFIGLRGSIAVYAGLGVKNVLCVYVRGYAGYTASINLRPGNSDWFNWRVDLNANVQLVVEALFGLYSTKFTFLKWELHLPMDFAPVDLANSNNTENVKIEGVRPYVDTFTEEYALKEGLKTVCISSDDLSSTYLGFYIKTEDLKYPDIRCIRLTSSYAGMSAEQVRIPYVGHTAFDGTPPKDAYVYMFEVTEISESGNRSKADEGEGVVGLTLMMARRSEDVPDPEHPGETMPGKTYGETHYFFRNKQEDVQHCYGSRIRPVDGAVSDLNMEFFYEDGRYKQIDDRNVWVEDYAAVVSWRMRTDLMEIHALAENVNVHSSYRTQWQGADHYFVTTKFLTQQSSRNTETREFYEPDHMLLTPKNILSYQVVYHDKTDYNLEHRVPILLEFTTLCDCGAANAIFSDMVYCLDGCIYSDIIRTQWGFVSGDIYSMQYIDRLMTTRDGQPLDACSRYFILKDENDVGKYNAYIQTIVSPYCTPSEYTTTDLGITVSPTNYYVNDLGSSLGVYDLQVLSPSANESDARYVYKVVYLVDQGDDRYTASKPFTLAVFDKDQLDPVKGVTSIKMMRQPTGFLQGVAVENKSATDNSGSIVKNFSFSQQADLKLSCAELENPLVKAGDTVNLLINALNVGNIPVSSFMLRLTATDVASGEHKSLGSIRVDCANPADSSLLQFDLDGEEIAHVRGESAVSSYAAAKTEEKDFWVTENDAGVQNAMFTRVLMPEDTQNYRVPFTIPNDLAGHRYNVTLSVGSISTLAAYTEDGKLDSTAAWIYTLESMDAQTRSMRAAASAPVLETVTFVFPEDAPDMAPSHDTDAPTCPVDIFVGEMPDDGTVPVMTSSTDMAMLSMYSAYAQPSSVQIRMDYIDLELNSSIYESNGQTMVHMIITNATSMPAENICLTATLDGEETYAVNLNGSAGITAAEAISVEMPLDVLTQGKTGDRLSLEISCNGNEYFTVNNTFDYLLKGLFAIVNDPQNLTVEIDSIATFDVSARGGRKPYSYQWQVSKNGQNGVFIAIDGANNKSLILDPVTDADNGNFYRCVVTDAAGQMKISASALLLVQSHPFVIVLQPADQNVPEGQSVQFSVMADGGNKPYSYQWQVSTSGPNGGFTNVPNATDSTLILERVTEKDHGKYFRCIVSDSIGRRLISSAAKLEVVKIPVTGDDTPVELLFVVGGFSLMLMVLLLYKRKRDMSST